MSKNHPVDVHVGSRIRQRRVLLGLSQTDLGEAAGITFQQIQKYENGTNRCSASMLFGFAQTLDVDVGYFFEDAPVNGRHKPLSTMAGDPLIKRETLELVRAYYRIDKPAVRASIFEMVKSVGRGLKEAA